VSTVPIIRASSSSQAGPATLPYLVRHGINFINSGLPVVARYAKAVPLEAQLSFPAWCILRSKEEIEESWKRH
jgi:hypothetical protein